jgi:tryptophan-rich sensory protein
MNMLKGFTSLWANIAEALVLSVVDDSFILLFGGGDLASPEGRRFLPAVPGWFIGIVWLVVFLWIAAETANLRALGGQDAERAARRLRRLLFGAAAYPFYTAGLRSAIIGIFGNLFTIGLAGAAFGQLRRIRLRACLLLAAVIGWLIFASLLILDENRWFW